MSVGMRVRHLIVVQHGDSLRKAEEKTGVSYETIRRIINGYEGPTIAYHVERIAIGYGVDKRALLEGMDPRGDFEWTIHQAPLAQRLEFLTMNQHERVRLTLDFLQGKYPAACSTALLAAASGLTVSETERIFATWPSRAPDLATTQTIATSLHRLTGISMEWFRYGWLASEQAQKALVDRIGQLSFRLAPDAKRHPMLLQELQGFVSMAG